MLAPPGKLIIVGVAKVPSSHTSSPVTAGIGAAENSASKSGDVASGALSTTIVESGSEPPESGVGETTGWLSPHAISAQNQTTHCRTPELYPVSLLILSLRCPPVGSTNAER